MNLYQCAPSQDILVCDEPISPLDVSVQEQILKLLDDLKTRSGLSTIFVSHDSGIIRTVSNDLIDIKSGPIFEYGPINSQDPKTPTHRTDQPKTPH